MPVLTGEDLVRLNAFDTVSCRPRQRLNDDLAVVRNVTPAEVPADLDATAPCPKCGIALAGSTIQPKGALLRIDHPGGGACFATEDEMPRHRMELI